MVKNEGYSCPIGKNLEEALYKFQEETALRVEEMHLTMNRIIEHTQHLNNLDAIALAITDMKTGLISSATGKNHIPVDMMDKVLEQVGASNRRVIWVFGTICIGLLLVIGYLLIGEHFNLIRQLNH